ncbi:S1 RNA-binding domain-containing protein [Candidatus Woesearchaeota archaeon]|nr:S1 RNA-binding domain-containing protein [Candidatus Woesearchaeota archaeon]
MHVKEGFPEEDDLVLCTVNNIHFHSVFAKLDEYNKTGLIHISEISPGRIRNIRDYVVEGKKIVCKVLRIDRKKGHIDLSLRRVNENQRKKKVNEIKQEQKAESIIAQVAKANKLDYGKFYNELKEKIFSKYEDFRSCFSNAVKDPALLESLGIEKKAASQLMDIIKVRFKEEDVVIGGKLKLVSYEPNGLDIIKASLKNAEETGAKINYSGGGMYNIHVTSKNYKDAEKILDKALKKALAFTKKSNALGEFTRK